jgi:hypothetical protein
MQNTVKLLDDGIIYVEKFGDQTELSLFELTGRISLLATELRKQDKPVLILTNATAEGTMDKSAIAVATKIGQELDYDKSASYGAPGFLHVLRENLITEAKLDAKVANFVTREEALAWLCT